MSKVKKYLIASSIGFINAVFGAGGGMIAVPYLKSLGLPQKNAQATAISVIFPLTLVSSFVYLKRGYVTFSDALPFLPAGVLGAVAGTRLLPKMKDSVLKIMFSFFMIWAGLRLITG